MAQFFPRQTIAWKVEEPPAFRRLTLSLLEMAILTGVVLRLYRALALTHGARDSFLYLGAIFLVGAAFLYGMATLHLANYPVRHWLWRAPAFALVEASAEALMSLLLITVHREPLGSVRAEFADWPQIAVGLFVGSWRHPLGLLLGRAVSIALFALILAGVVQVVRRAMLRRENRERTADRIADDYERRSSQIMPLPPER